MPKNVLRIPKTSANKVLVVGLTGGIGSGKTAASEFFKQKGIMIIDADVISRSISQSPEVVAKITEHFGQRILLADGSIDRSKLRSIIFSTPSEKIWLEQLLHPKIRAQIQQQIQLATSAYVILSAPLLLENDIDQITDRVLVIDVPEKLQLARAIARDDCSEEVVKQIMSSQLKRQDRLSRADDVADNSQDLSHLEKQVNELHQKYLLLSG